MSELTREGWRTLATRCFSAGLNYKQVEKVLDDARFSFVGDVDELEEFEKIMVDAQKDFKNSKPAVVDVRQLSTIGKDIVKYQIEVLDAQKSQFKLPGFLGEASGGLRKGELAYIIARSGSFKTCFLQNILYNHYLKHDGLGLFFSFEMPPEGVAGRALQMLNRVNAWDLEAEIRKNSPAMQQYVNSKDVKTISERTLNYYGVPLNVLQMGEYISLAENMTGKKVTAIGIDYMGYIQGSGGSTYEKVSEIARTLKTHLARQYEVPVVCLTQANREAKDGTEEVYLHSGRDSGAIEESADFAYGLWQDKERGRVVGNILKERRRLDNDPQWEHDDYRYFALDIEKSKMYVAGVERILKPEKNNERPTI